MAKYGLQRGIDGSKARHKSTQQYYRDIQKLSDDLKAEVVDLQQHKETAREELRRAKKEIQTMQADHSRQMAEVERKHRREIADKETKHKEEISFLKTVIAKAAA